MTITRTVRAVAAAAVALVALAGCSTTTYEVGETPDQQMCHALESVIEGANSAPFRLEPLLASFAETPDDLSPELLLISLVYQSAEDEYDRLGEYEPAFRFSVRFVELAQAGLIGPSTLSPKVERSAKAVDRALTEDVCG